MIQYASLKISEDSLRSKDFSRISSVLSTSTWHWQPYDSWICSKMISFGIAYNETLANWRRKPTWFYPKSLWCRDHIYVFIYLSHWSLRDFIEIISLVLKCPTSNTVCSHCKVMKMALSNFLMSDLLATHSLLWPSKGWVWN